MDKTVVILLIILIIAVIFFGVSSMRNGDDQISGVAVSPQSLPSSGVAVSQRSLPDQYGGGGCGR